MGPDGIYKSLRTSSSAMLHEHHPVSNGPHLIWQKNGHHSPENLRLCLLQDWKSSKHGQVSFNPYRQKKERNGKGNDLMNQ